MATHELGPQGQTPYENVLRTALETAQLGRNWGVARRLDEMIAALTRKDYAALSTLWTRLPPVYQAVTGKPPSSPADDV